MGTDKINLFEQAIKQNEWLAFALGEKEYFVLDREYGEHWVLGAWDKYIFPYIKARGEEIANPFIVEMISHLMNSTIDPREKNDAILLHLRVYYYRRHEGKVSSDAFAGQAEKIRKYLEDYRDALALKDKEQADDVTRRISLVKEYGGLVHCK